MKSYEKLKSILECYIDKESLELVDAYYNEAVDIYDKMKRLTNEDYIEHSINVAILLAELKMDPISIGCSLIHEAITLEKRTYEQIEEKFGEESAVILNSITKLSNFKRNFKGNNTEKYRRIVVGLSENPKALFIKLADRLDNLRTIEVHNLEHRKEVIDETTNIFIPIAHRLGIKKIKSEMEDYCLRASNPEKYNEVLNKINADKSELEKSLNNMREEIIELLNDHEIKFEILSRVKSVRGIYNKLAIGKKWSDIYDLLGIRVLVDKVEECYLVIGLIHSKYRPIPKRFKDYIANPKSNMYQSVHTTVFGVDGRMYEVQVRTYEMDQIAESGVASHWSYKEKTDGSKKGDIESKLEAFKTLIEVNDLQGNIDFFKNLDTNLNKDEIFVFTPKGDIIELPVGSTPIDFAYRIHSEIGNMTRSALVNGKIVRLDYELKDSDIVDLKTQTGKGPSKAWIKFVKTDQAKSRIKSYFYKKEKEKLIETGKELLITEIKKRKRNINELLNDEVMKECLRVLKIDNIEDLYTGISLLKYSSNVIVNKLIQILEPKEVDATEILLKDNYSKNTKSDIIVAGTHDILTSNANCCTPVLGEEIIAYVTKTKGIVIHRKDCKNIDLTSDRILEATWNNRSDTKYLTYIDVAIDSNNDNLMTIIAIATKLDISIVSYNLKKKNKNDETFEIACKVKNKDTLDTFMTELYALKFITRIERTNKL